MPADTGLAMRQAYSAATLLVFGGGLVLYQMTSLMLGPAGSRQLDLSLSIPTVAMQELVDPLAARSGVIGNLVAAVSATSGSKTISSRTSGRTATHPGTAPVPRVPVVAPPSIVTVPPVAPPARPAARTLPVVTVPQPERGDLQDE